MSPRRPAFRVIDPTDTPDLRARYDILAQEVQRERQAWRDAMAEVATLRLALGLHPTGTPSTTRPRTSEGG
jgi:hypothetical protein